MTDPVETLRLHAHAAAGQLGRTIEMQRPALSEGSYAPLDAALADAADALSDIRSQLATDESPQP